MITGAATRVDLVPRLTTTLRCPAAAGRRTTRETERGAAVEEAGEAGTVGGLYACSLGTVISGNWTLGMVNAGSDTASTGGFRAALIEATTVPEYGSEMARIPNMAHQKRCRRVPRLLSPKWPRPSWARPPAYAYAGGPKDLRLDTAPQFRDRGYVSPLLLRNYMRVCSDQPLRLTDQIPWP